MKTMPATKVSHQFGKFLDEVQRAPVIVTKKDRPVAMTISMRDAKEFMDFRITNGIDAGLADIEAGRFVEITPENTAKRIANFKALIAAK